MFRPRIIPLLLIRNDQLVKSIGFQNHRYIGDPVNTARLFSEMKADELILLDIDAGSKSRTISPEMIRTISNETSMPLAAGGGIRSLDQIEKLISSGAEKVIIGTAAFEDPSFLEAAAKEFGSSTVSVCADVFQDTFGKYHVRYKNASEAHTEALLQTCLRIQNAGAGELILQSVNRDGMKTGYDNKLIRSVSEKLAIPVVSAGGAGSLDHLSEARKSGASAMAAGSLFVFHRNGVLISYPDRAEVNELFSG